MGFLKGQDAFRKTIALEYSLHPSLKPFSDGDRAGMLGQETAEAFAKRKWLEQAEADRAGRPRERGKNPISSRRYTPGTLRQSTATQCPRQLPGDATLPQAMYLEPGRTEQATVLDVPRARSSNRIRQSKCKRATVRLGQEQRRAHKLRKVISMPWWRSVIGLLAGGAQAYAGGLDWKHVLAGLGIAALGVVSHVTSTSGKTWKKVE